MDLLNPSDRAILAMRKMRAAAEVLNRAGIDISFALSDLVDGLNDIERPLIPAAEANAIRDRLQGLRTLLNAADYGSFAGRIERVTTEACRRIP
jgi:hypothetical protein